ncbi:MAG: helix-turn-helix transcriptional regulator [Bacteroidota bacterium]
MEYFKEMRIELGLSQNEFADLIGCNEGQLAMAESGRRNLPRAAANFVRLLTHEPANPSSGQADNVYTQAELKAMEMDLRKRTLQISKLEERSDALEIKTRHAGNMIAKSAAIQNSGVQMDETTQLTLVVLQRKAIEKQSRYRKQWFACLAEIAGLQAANEKAGQLLLSLAL